MEVEAVKGIASAYAVEDINIDDRVDMNTHGQRAVSARSGRDSDGVVNDTFSGCVEYDTVPDYGQIVFADKSIDGGYSVLIDGENERDGGVASEDVGCVLDIGACHIVVDAVECIRQVVLVNGDFQSVFGGQVDGEVEGNDGVAAENSGVI